MHRWFSERLANWYRQNKRDLPWRHTKDPYRIWLSEIILQQTQVNQGLAYYHRFIQQFPEIKHLAAAGEEQVLKLWQGLGYYSRARNLHFASNQVMEQHSGTFPTQYAQIRQLKGVGDYTAAAIASFAFDQPEAVVDGNVYRLLSRLFAINIPVDSTRAKKIFQDLASTLLDKAQPARHNQAIMEFGSQFCRPVNPDCGQCIFADKCQALANGLVDRLPLKSKKLKVKQRFFNYLVITDKTRKLLVRRRLGKDIWQGLYEFPMIETPDETDIDALFRHKDFGNLVQGRPELLRASEGYAHTLTHQQLFARFYVLRTGQKLNAHNHRLVTISELQKLAWPRLIEKFMADCDLKEII